MDAIFLRPLASGGWHPDAGQALVARRVEVERSERPDERLLEVADVALHVLAVLREVEDRVADELSGAVERRLAATVGLGDLDGCVVGDVQLDIGLGPPADRDDGGCSRKMTVSGIAPCETAPASERWSSNASPYGTRPRFMQIRAARHARKASRTR